MTEALLAQWKDRVLEAQTEISVVQDEINSVLQQRKALKQSIRRYEDTVAQEKRALLVQLEEVEAKAKDLSARCEATIRQKDEVEAVYVKTLDEYESMHYLVREIKDQEEQLAQREDLEAKLQRDSLAWAEEEHTLRTKLRKLQLARSEELQAQRNEIVTLEAAIAAAEQKQQKARQEHQAGRQQKIHGMKLRMNAKNNSAVRQGEEEEERVGSAHSHTTSANMNDGRVSQARRSTTRATTAAPSLHNNNNNNISGRNTMPSPVYDNNNDEGEENGDEQSNMEKMYNNPKSNRTYPGATRARSAYTLPTSSATAPLTGDLSRNEGSNNDSYTGVNNNNTMASSRMMSMPAIHDPPFESDELAPRTERGCLPNQSTGAMRPLKSCLKNTSSNNNTTTNNNSSGNTTLYPASTNTNNNNSGTMNAQNESNTWDTDTHYSSYTRGGNANKPLSAPVSRAGSQSLLAGPNGVQGPYDNTLDTYQPGQTRYTANINEGSGQRDEVQAFSRAAMMSGGLPTRAYSYNSGKRLSRKRDVLGDSTNYQ